MREIGRKTEKKMCGCDTERAEEGRERAATLAWSLRRRSSSHLRDASGHPGSPSGGDSGRATVPLCPGSLAQRVSRSRRVSGSQNFICSKSFLRFFVISGYLIFTILRRTVQKEGHLRLSSVLTFYYKRMARILPLRFRTFEKKSDRVRKVSACCTSRSPS